MPFRSGDCRAFSLAPIAGAGRAVRGDGGGLPSIIGHVPAAALELNGWRRQNALKAASAFLTPGQRRIRKLLDFLNVLSALRASILVKRQFNLLTKALTSIIYARPWRVKKYATASRLCVKTPVCMPFRGVPRPRGRNDSPARVIAQTL